MRRGRVVTALQETEPWPHAQQAVHSGALALGAGGGGGDDDGRGNGRVPGGCGGHGRAASPGPGGSKGDTGESDDDVGVLGEARLGIATTVPHTAKVRMPLCVLSNPQFL